jgi:hypothetical protein
MTSKLVGFRRFQYKRKSDGQQIDACNLYLVSPGGKDVVGEMCEAVFCKSDIVPKDLKVGDNIQVYYNRYGSVESVDNKF